MFAKIAASRAASLAGPAATPMAALGAALVVLVCAGCAGGLIGPLPPLQRPAEAATVSVFRELHLAGFVGPIILSIDGCRTFRVWGNQEYSFQLDPGQYVFDYTIGFNECRRIAFVEPGRNYRFRLAPNCDRFNDGCGTGVVTSAPGLPGAEPVGSAGAGPATGRPCGGFDAGCN